MLQALATCFFVAVVLIGLGSIAAFLRHDWEALLVALGLATPATTPTPLPPRYRVRPMRRATSIRIDLPTQRRAAA